MTTTVIIIHYNTPDLLKKQLELITKKSLLEIIVVDNASEKSLNDLKKRYNDVIFLQNKRNMGFAFACNQGVVASKGEWLLFLNPDVEITAEQIDEMIKIAKKNNFDACSPMGEKAYMKHLPTSLSLLKEFTPLAKIPFLNDLGGTDDAVGEEHAHGVKKMVLSKNKTLTGGCLFIKRDILLNLGGWDERFFLWFEDSDLTKRLIDNNYTVGWVHVPIKHSGGASVINLTTQQQRDIFFHSMDIYARKHFTRVGKWVTHYIKRRYTTKNLLPFMGNKSGDFVSITIPNMKKNLLKSFFDNNLPMPALVGETIIVTSALSDEEVWEWRKKYAEIRFILKQKTEGFAVSVNTGFRVSTGYWIGTINDDVDLSKNWLNFIKGGVGDVGSCNPTIKKSNGLIESIGIKVLDKGKAEPITHTYDSKSTLEVDATNGACVMYTRSALEKTGIYDERFGSYLEDIDLSLRLKRNGFKNIVDTTAFVTHAGQSTSKSIGVRKQWYDTQNWIFVILKNWGIKKLLIHFPEIIIERLRNLSGLLKSLLTTIYSVF